MFDKIDKSNANPEILQAYYDARNDRRSQNYLLSMALGGKGVFFLTFMTVMMFDISGFARMYILLGVSGCYLLTCFALTVAWSPSGMRLRTLAIIVGLIGICALATILGGWLFDLLLRSAG